MLKNQDTGRLTPILLPSKISDRRPSNTPPLRPWDLIRGSDRVSNVPTLTPISPDPLCPNSISRTTAGGGRGVAVSRARPSAVRGGPCLTREYTINLAYQFKREALVPSPRDAVWNPGEKMNSLVLTGATRPQECSSFYLFLSSR